MNKVIVEINSSTVGSTGKIMFMIAQILARVGYITYTCSAVHGNEKRIDADTHIYIGNKLDKKIHLELARNTGYNGCFSRITTKHFLYKLDKLKPDLIHLHNLHNCYINLELLFNYIKEKKIPIVWTLHDCWAFTGHCTYYDFIQCNKWKVRCHDCPQIANYPYSNVDRSQKMYYKKKSWFTGANITLVSPSKWLGHEVGDSFLSAYPLKVINNGIDLEVFKPTNSNFREQHNLGNNFIVLGVASSWGPRKGLDVFVKLAKTLPIDFSVIIVGIEEEDRKILPANVIAISRTNSKKELAEIYTAADVFVLPTKEENFPTTSIEALACGTGVITYKTGGCPEIVSEETAIVIEKDDYKVLKEAILTIKDHPFDSEKCRNRALLFDGKKKFEEYAKLFAEILKEQNECL